MKELTINERAKKGIPSFAITKNAYRLDNFEGFDSKGNFWYHTFTNSMKPKIQPNSYLCLRRIDDINEITGYNGEIYVFAISSGNVLQTLTGHVINKPRNSDFVRVLTTFPTNCTNDVPKKIIVEQYLVLGIFEQMPTPWHP